MNNRLQSVSSHDLPIHSVMTSALLSKAEKFLDSWFWRGMKAVGDLTIILNKFALWNHNNVSVFENALNGLKTKIVRWTKACTDWLIFFSHLIGYPTHQLLLGKCIIKCKDTHDIFSPILPPIRKNVMSKTNKVTPSIVNFFQLRVSSTTPAIVHTFVHFLTIYCRK